MALALAHRVGGVAGMILLAAAAGCGAFLIALMARECEWPLWVAALSWLPALTLIGTRLDPRPEVFSLVFLAGFLAILLRVERRPTLAWILPPIQVVWVNCHSLFILGPIVLGFFLIDRSGRRWSNSRAGESRPGAEPQHILRHLVPVSLAVALACLANPYGVRGATLPLGLFLKIADPTNPYKTYIDEFASLREAVLSRMIASPGTHYYLRAEIFLLLLLPWSFLLPAAWRECRSSGRGGIGEGAGWTIGSAAALSLALMAALGLPLPETPTWLVRIGLALPFAVPIIGGLTASVLFFRSRWAAATVGIGAMAVGVWSSWINAYLFNEAQALVGMSLAAMSYLGTGLGLFAAALVYRSGGSAFRMLLTVAFTELCFQAVRNINLFGLVAGTVLSWNLGEWIASVAGERPIGRSGRIPDWALPSMVMGLVVLCSVAVVSDRYYAFAGEQIRFGLRERSLTFAHDAARFAGRPGLPGRALVYHLGQTGVYIYHNGPDLKVYMDARLEVPARSTFETYVQIEDSLNRNDGRWDAAVSRLGDPLILLGHEGETEAEASLLAHPRWRCIYFDAIASIFVPRQGKSSAPSYAEFDFAARRSQGAGESIPAIEARQTMAEAQAYFRLGSALRKRSVDPWQSRIPILIGASDRVRRMLSSEPNNPALWRLLGLIHWEMVPNLSRPPPGPTDPWDPASGLPWVRATYCFRRALEAAPGDIPTLRALADCFRVRRMNEALARSRQSPREKTEAKAPSGSRQGRPIQLRPPGRSPIGSP